MICGRIALACSGIPIVKTPHLDKLLEQRIHLPQRLRARLEQRRRLHAEPHDDSDRAELSAHQPHHPDAGADDQGRRIRLDPQRQVRQQSERARQGFRPASRRRRPPRAMPTTSSPSSRNTPARSRCSSISRRTSRTTRNMRPRNFTGCTSPRTFRCRSTSCRSIPSTMAR